MVVPQQLDGLFHGKFNFKMVCLGVPPWIGNLQMYKSSRNPTIRLHVLKSFSVNENILASAICDTDVTETCSTGCHNGCRMWPLSSQRLLSQEAKPNWRWTFQLFTVPVSSKLRRKSHSTWSVFAENSAAVLRFSGRT